MSTNRETLRQELVKARKHLRAIQDVIDQLEEALMQGEDGMSAQEADEGSRTGSTIGEGDHVRIMTTPWKNRVGTVVGWRGIHFLRVQLEPNGHDKAREIWKKPKNLRKTRNGRKKPA